MFIKCIVWVVKIIVYKLNNFRNKINVYSIDHTIEFIILNKSSVVRFGDGELEIIKGNSIGFQTYNSELSSKLANIIKCNVDNLLVCLPDVFGNLSKYNLVARRYWIDNLYKNRKIWEEYCIKDKIYYNSFISRPYMDYKNKNNSRLWFEKIKKIWNNRDVVIIEGCESRLGINNDLFNNAKTVERIICPKQNAYEKYEKILKASLGINLNKLILLALGPTAKPLTYDLHLNGFQVIDIGHLDIEYEWFLRCAVNKISIPNKHVNEVKTINIDYQTINNETYRKQIIEEIV